MACGGLRGEDQRAVPVTGAGSDSASVLLKTVSFFTWDNGSEYINYPMTGVLNKMLIGFTRSRANRSQDNALVEGKNGAPIRKHIGYGYIPAPHAEALRKFYTAHFNPYRNCHRSCGFAITSFTARGKRKRTCRAEDYKTPHEKLKSPADAVSI
jgi:hypothetical protein